MNAKKLKKYKDLLLNEKRRILDELLSGNESYNSIKEETHGDIVDIAFQDYEKQVLIGFSQKEKEKLEIVNASLRKIDDGSYGVCIDCKNDIAEPRLDAIPFAQRCITCMGKHEEKKRRERM